jgi:hypothetical protein
MNLEEEVEPFKDSAGFELIARKLGVTMPKKVRSVVVCDDNAQP